MAESPNSLNHNDIDLSGTGQERAHLTRGQKLFNWSVYGVVNGVGNFLITIPLAYWGIHGGGAKYFQRAGKVVEKLGMKAGRAKEMVEMLGTSLGGWAMLAPVYIAEHYRKPAVDWLNQTFGTEEDKQTVIHQPPKQTVGSLLIGRASAMAMVWAAFTTAGKFIPEQFSAFQEKVATKLCAIFKKPTLDALGQETKAYHYGKMAALDVFATASATVLLYLISRAAAQSRDNRRQHRAERKVHPLAGEGVALEIPQDHAVAATDVSTPDTKVVGEKLHAGMSVGIMPAITEAVQR